MKTLVALVALLLNISLYAQKIDSVGYLSNLKGKGFCIRKGNEANLKIPFFFVNGDKIKMLTGNAVVVLYNEEEVKLSSGESFTFPLERMSKTKDKDLMMFKMARQSITSFKIRGVLDSKSRVFPKQSKILDLSDAILKINSISDNRDRYIFTITDENTGQNIYQILDANADQINLSLTPVEKGNNYKWKIKFPEYEVYGEFEVLDDAQIKKFPVFELNNRASYVNAFNFYVNEGCYFNAGQIIEKAIQAYPEDDYYEYLKNSIELN
jgi:TolA-binding protein